MFLAGCPNIHSDDTLLSLYYYCCSTCDKFNSNDSAACIPQLCLRRPYYALACFNEVMTEHQKKYFTDTVWDYFAHNGRNTLPWRQGADKDTFAYKVLVSEMMLQQTQVNRVVIKFEEWMQRFPTVQAAANTSFSDCLNIWSGLGYNRRAKFLHESCKQIVALHQGNIPQETTALVSMPGIGVNTAAAIQAYAFNMPVAFIETNIRTVYIYHFFKGKNNINDSDISALVAATVDTDNPREWYWALMDYGSYLKRTIGHQNSSSAHYTKQSKFEGSRRQLRGKVLRTLQQKPHTIYQLEKELGDDRLREILATLEKESFIENTGVVYKISS